jgi:hypothetical protein
MSIFEDESLDEYRQDDRVIESLRGHILLNKSEFMAWMDPPKLRESTGTSKSRKDAREITREHVTEVHNEQLQQLATHVCNGIVEDYGIETMDQIINDVDDYDLLVAVTPDYNTVGTAVRTKTITNNKIDKVVGFIATELGECKKEPNVVSVKLICAKDGTIRGGLLMGAYLYCLKKQRTYKKMGILELARGYLNIAGFISYTKLGFNKDLSLYGARCFSDYANLPMSVNLTRITEETIINRATENERRTVNVDEDDSGIYVLGRAITESLLVNNNLLMKAEMDYNKLKSEDNELKPLEQTQFQSIIAKLSGKSKTSATASSKKTKKSPKSPITIHNSVFVRELKSLISNEVETIIESQRKPSAKSKSSKKGGLRNKRTRKNRRL